MGGRTAKAAKAAAAATPEGKAAMEALALGKAAVGLLGRGKGSGAVPATPDAATASVGLPVATLPHYLITLKRPRVRVRSSKGVRWIEVVPGKGLDAKELLLAALVGGMAVAGYEGYSYLKAKGDTLTNPSKNALGIPFGGLFPGGGANPFNYLFP